MNLILDKYQIVRVISEKGNKSIMLLKNRNTSEIAVGKIQPESVLEKKNTRNVLHEASYLQSLQGYPGIPYMHWSGKTVANKIVLIVEQLGDTLDDRLKQCSGNFSLKTVCMLGIQMIKLIHCLHEKGLIHRKIQLKSFQFGRSEKANTIHLNNFMQTKHYRDNKTMQFIIREKRNQYPNLSIFDSTSAHHGIEKSRRDDMESLVLLLVYLIKGELPWSFCQDIKDFNEVNKNKQFQNEEFACDGVPKAFEDMLRDSRSLGFHDEPNYHWYILKLKAMLYQIGQQHDYIYDWFFSTSYQSGLTLPKYPSVVQIEEDDDFLDYLEQQCFDSIDLNEVERKHDLLFEKMKQIEQNSRNQIENINRGNVLQQGKEGKDVKEGQVNENKKMKRIQKQKCSLM